MARQFSPTTSSPERVTRAGAARRRRRVEGADQRLEHRIGGRLDALVPKTLYIDERAERFGGVGETRSERGAGERDILIVRPLEKMPRQSEIDPVDAIGRAVERARHEARHIIDRRRRASTRVSAPVAEALAAPAVDHIVRLRDRALGLMRETFAIAEHQSDIGLDLGVAGRGRLGGEGAGRQAAA